MAGLIVFSPDSDEVGLSTGDDIAVNTYLDIQSDTLYFTDGSNIYEWEGDDTVGGPLRQTYIWRSGEIRLPSLVNLGAAIVEAESYSESIGVVVGDDYFDDVIYLGKYEGADTATAYTELSPNAQTHSFYGNAQIDTAQFNYGASSLVFDGTGDGIQADTPLDTQLNDTDEVTVEGFVRFTSLPSGAGVDVQLVNQANQDINNFEVRFGDLNGAGLYQVEARFGFGNTPTGVLAAPTLNVWYYFAAQRRLNGANYYVDIFWGLVSSGTASRLSQTLSNNNPSAVTTVPITIGAWDNATTQVFTQVVDGHIDDIRLTRAARFGNVASVTIPSDYLLIQAVPGAVYDVTFRLYADGVLKHTQTVTDDEPFRLPGGYLSNIYSVEIESALPVTRINVGESVFELTEG